MVIKRFSGIDLRGFSCILYPPEEVFVSKKLGNKKCIVSSCFTAPYESNTKNFVHYFCEKVSMLRYTSTELLIWGDFSLEFFKVSFTNKVYIFFPAFGRPHTSDDFTYKNN